MRIFTIAARFTETFSISRSPSYPNHTLYRKSHCDQRSCCPIGASANEKWLIGEFENFRIHSNANERKTVSIIEDLNEVRTA